MRNLNKQDKAKISDFISVSVCTLIYILVLISVNFKFDFNVLDAFLNSWNT
ncbi:MAG: hypothetical protein ACI4WH_08635 [Oscillospiraceae bacterium]